MDGEYESIKSAGQSFRVDDAKIQSILSLLKAEFRLEPFDVSVTFVSPERMTELNDQFRNKPTSTDVLSFPQMEFPEPLTGPYGAEELPTNNASANEVGEKHLGDVIISIIDAKRNALDIGQALDREVCFLLVHGFLHLCGHDHQIKEEAEIMTQLEKQLMARLNAQKPPCWAQCVMEVNT